jgi:hypothetical protein
MTKTTRFGIRGLCGAVAAALFLGLVHPALAGDQPQWVRQLGTSDGDPATAVTTDGDGNVYIAGNTGGSLGGPQQGQFDAWVAKYSVAGALHWTRQLGTSEEEAASGVATDGDGNVYIAGVTLGSLGGSNRGSGDAWVSKYSAAGALRWKRQLGTARFEFARGVATDGDGNVYIAGYTEGALGGQNQGDSDAWLASTIGALRWKRQLGTAAFDEAQGVATDGDGNVYIAGQTGGSLGGPNRGSGDAWAAKYSATGALRWKRQLGTAAFDEAQGVATDGGGNVYIAGATGGSLGGPSRGFDDAWVAKYSAAGALLWRRQLGTADFDDATGVATDGGGNVYIAGWTGGSLGGGNQGSVDAWVAKYSVTGGLRWKRQLGTSDIDAAYGVATNGDRKLYIAGTTQGSLGGPNQGSVDAWVAQYLTRP